jgi:hypothetical protein
MKDFPSVERETIRSAMRHRILGSASAEAMVVLALVFSICVILFIMTADAAFAQTVQPPALNDNARNIIGAWLVAILGFMCVLTARMLWGFNPHRAPMKTPRRR